MLVSEINMINDWIVSKNMLHFKKEMKLCALMKGYRNDVCTTENIIRACYASFYGCPYLMLLFLFGVT